MSASSDSDCEQGLKELLLNQESFLSGFGCDCAHCSSQFYFQDSTLADSVRKCYLLSSAVSNEIDEIIQLRISLYAS